MKKPPSGDRIAPTSPLSRSPRDDRRRRHLASLRHSLSPPTAPPGPRRSLRRQPASFAECFRQAAPRRPAHCLPHQPADAERARVPAHRQAAHPAVAVVAELKGGWAPTLRSRRRHSGWERRRSRFVVVARPAPGGAPIVDSAGGVRETKVTPQAAQAGTPPGGTPLLTVGCVGGTSRSGGTLLAGSHFGAMGERPASLVIGSGYAKLRTRRGWAVAPSRTCPAVESWQTQALDWARQAAPAQRGTARDLVPWQECPRSNSPE